MNLGANSRCINSTQFRRRFGNGLLVGIVESGSQDLGRVVNDMSYIASGCFPANRTWYGLPRDVLLNKVGLGENSAVFRCFLPTLR